MVNGRTSKKRFNVQAESIINYYEKTKLKIIGTNLPFIFLIQSNYFYMQNVDKNHYCQTNANGFKKY